MMMATAVHAKGAKDEPLPRHHAKDVGPGSFCAERRTGHQSRIWTRIGDPVTGHRKDENADAESRQMRGIF